jgi:hypothetical protein
MDLNFLNSLLNPAILFFFLGLLSVLIKSDLEIPQPISKFLSIYLLMSIGFHGGVELSNSGFSKEAVICLTACLFMAAFVPFYCFFILKKFLSLSNASLIASTYGSISAVTFITAISFLKDLNIASSGFMVAAMALMEFPAIVVGIMLFNIFSQKDDDEEKQPIHKIIWETFANSSVYLILGSLFAGLVSNSAEAHSLKPFTEDLFKGMLCIFMLDMGLLAAKRISTLKKATPLLFSFAILVPIFNALLAIFLAYYLKLSIGNAFIFTVLSASASYVAVPAAMRTALPKSDLSLSVPLALAVTFPFNIIIGLPSYYFLIKHLWG